jgi:SSS family solute:Na+ symporter
LPALSSRLWITPLVVAYLAVTVCISGFARKSSRDSGQYLNATRSLPLWCSTLAFIAANCGALDVIAMMSLGAQYGALAFHFYWIGAVPALIVLALWLLPAYRISRAVTIFEFLGRHYGRATRTLVALSISVVMTMLTGIGLYAVAQVLSIYIGWSFLASVLVTAAVILACAWSGGVKATIYSEVLHLSIVLAAVSPLVFIVLHKAGGASSWLHSIPASRIHAWQNLHLFAPAEHMDVLGLVVGLGAILSLGYWSTDFILMQRALSVQGESRAQTIPLAAALAKIGFSLLIVVPGIAAPHILGTTAARFDQTLPALILHLYPGILADLGILGVLAALMVNLSAHLSAVSAMWTYDLYQASIRPGRPDAHYLKAGRLANAAAIGLAILGAFTALRYKSIMEYVQFLLATINAPLLGILAPAVLTRSATSAGGFWGFALGLTCAILHQALYRTGFLHYGSQLAADFYGGIGAFAVALCTASFLGGLGNQAEGDKWSQRRNLAVLSPQPALSAPIWSTPVTVLTLAAILLFAVCNAVFW